MTKPRKPSKLDERIRAAAAQAYADGRDSARLETTNLARKLMEAQERIKELELERMSRNGALQVLQSIAHSNEAIGKALGDILQPRRI